MSDWRRWLYHGARVSLGAIFLYAGLVKALEVTAFAGQIASYRLLPVAGNVGVAVTLPYVELLAGALLIGGRKVRPAALLVGLLNLLFIGALASAWARGLTIDCGCFRPGGAATSIPLALLRDLVFLALAIIVLRYWPGPRRS